MMEYIAQALYTVGFIAWIVYVVGTVVLTCIITYIWLRGGR